MRNAALKLDPRDNAPLAFRDLPEGTPFSSWNQGCALVADVLEHVVNAARGEVLTKAELTEHNDFIPGKRGISL
jgi:hypothetical protein